MADYTNARQLPRVVIIGAGFGGLEAARKLANAPVEVLLLDRNNYHGFWPLLYQVATSGLEPQQIAQPVRAVLRRARNTTFRMATVQHIDRAQQTVITDRGTFPYDHLVVAAGSTTNFYGLEQIREHGFELKDLPDALAIRNHVIASFEQAVAEADPERVRRLLTFVVVGGGPTGVEMSGAIAELIRHVLLKDYPGITLQQVRVILLEAADRLLLAFPPKLAAKAQRRLEKMGVEVRLNANVVGYEQHRMQLKDGTPLDTDTVIWAAGVQASPLGAALDVPLQRGGRVSVTPELRLPDDPHVWVIGDLAYLTTPDGKPVPQLATAALQMGRTAARNILATIQSTPLQPFRYRDKGSMATVGRRAAVARIWGLSWSGPIAWLLWLAVHLWYLIGFRNRVLVLVNWAYNYFTYDRGSRALVHAAPDPTPLAVEEPLVAQQVGDTAEVIEPA